MKLLEFLLPSNYEVTFILPPPIYKKLNSIKFKKSLELELEKQLQKPRIISWYNGIPTYVSYGN